MPGAIDSDTAQILSAAIVQYIRDMGVDPGLFNIMTEAGASEIINVPKDRLVALNVINNGENPTKWSVESNGGVLYLKGERETWRGINKFILLCQPNKPFILYIIFDPEGNGEVVEKSMHAYSLFIDGNPIPLNSNTAQKPSLVNGWINAAFELTDDLIGKILKANTVGAAFQFNHGAPVFLGFDGMRFSEGAEKLTGLIRVCRHH